MVFDDGNKFCNRCGYFDKAGEGGSIVSNHKSKSYLTMEEANSLPLRKDGRGIEERVSSKFGIKIEYDTSTGEPKAYLYPAFKGGQLTGYKVRELPKRFHTIGDVKGCQLFGQHLFGKGNHLLITGGEEDALSAYQMMKMKYPLKEFAVVSLPSGENIKGLADNLDWVMQFKEIILCSDMDSAGRKCAESMAKMIGPKARIMEFSEKDANDMLNAGKTKEFINSFFAAKQYKPDSLITVDDVEESALVKPTYGIPWPWQSLTRATFGIRKGEGIYFGAGVKVGKSEAVNEIAAHLIKHGHKVLLMKPEEQPSYC